MPLASTPQASEQKRGKKPSQAAAIAYSEDPRTDGTSKKEQEYELGKCKIDEHRPCELASAVNFARDISKDYGTPIPPKLDAILKSKRVSENQVRAALNEWQYTLPNKGKKEAAYLIEAAFPN